MKKGVYHAEENDLTQLRITGLHGIGDKKKSKGTWRKSSDLKIDDLPKLKAEIRRLWGYGWRCRNIAGYLKISEPQFKRLQRELKLELNTSPVDPRELL